MSTFEKIGIEILKQRGFTDFKRSEKASFDYEAKKGNIDYAIEIKGTGKFGVLGRCIIPWNELRDLHLYVSGQDDNRKALLIFVNSIEDFAIFEMTESQIIL
jgi:hypothetical protein